MANLVYDNYKSLALSGDVDLILHTGMCMLVSGAYVPNQATHTVTGDVSPEVVGAGYTMGGSELLSRTISQVNNSGKFDADNITWSTSTITASGAVIYISGATPSTAYLVGYIDFAADKTSSGGDFTITWNTDGILLLG